MLHLQGKRAHCCFRTPLTLTLGFGVMGIGLSGAQLAHKQQQSTSKQVSIGSDVVFKPSPARHH
jgi:hypothetical protein